MTDFSKLTWSQARKAGKVLGLKDCRACEGSGMSSESTEQPYCNGRTDIEAKTFWPCEWGGFEGEPEKL